MKYTMNQNKYTGCLLGSAAGDALGMQTEGLSGAEIAHRFNVVFRYGPGRPGGPNEKLESGQFTDDTEQTIILARSIIEAGTFDAALFSKKLVQHYEKIIEHPELNRGWGSTSLAACEKLRRGTPWKESGVDVPTCGSAMRASPIGLLYPGNPDLAGETAAMSSLPTHSSPESMAGAAAVAAAVSLAAVNISPDIILQRAAATAKKYDPFTAGKIYSLEKVRYLNEMNAFSILGTSMMAHEVVPSALYCFARYPLDFPAAIIAAVNAGGDTDSIAAIAGALSGAYLGIDAVPKKWLQGLEACEEIKSLAMDLYEIGKNNI